MTTETRPETLKIHMGAHTVRLWWDNSEECIKAAIYERGTYNGIDGPTPLLRVQERQLHSLAEALP